MISPALKSNSYKALWFLKDETKTQPPFPSGDLIRRAGSFFLWKADLFGLPDSTIDISLDKQTAAIGNHVLTVTLSKSDNHADEGATNGRVVSTFQYYAPLPSVPESIEKPLFPPQAWDILGDDQEHT